MKPHTVALQAPVLADLCRVNKALLKMARLHQLMPAPVEMRSNLTKVFFPMEIHLWCPLWIIVLSNCYLLVGKPRQRELAP